MRLRRSTRLQTFNYLGCHRYSLTICTDRRQPLFVADEPVAGVLRHLSRTSDDFRFAVIAYCAMPDHLHVLAEGRHPASDFLAFVRLFKQCSAFHWKKTTGGVLWERGYYDHVLRADEDAVSVARYILNNPVRAGLVVRAEEHPYSGSMTLAMRELLYSVQL